MKPKIIQLQINTIVVLILLCLFFSLAWHSIMAKYKLQIMESVITSEIYGKAQETLRFNNLMIQEYLK